MEDTASSIAPALLSALRHLARRGATLRRGPDGSGTIETALRPRPVPAIPQPHVESMLASGWLRAAGDASTFVISRRGASLLRAMLSQPTSPTDLRPAVSVKSKRPPAIQEKPRDNGPSYNAQECPLAWLRQRRDKDGKPMIGEGEFLAGEQLRLDFERAQLRPRVTASWDPAAVSGSGPRGAPGMGLEMAEGVVAARQRVDRAIEAVGPELSGLLLDVCCFLHGLEDVERDRNWPRRSGKVVLQLALAHLARHYGFDCRARGTAARITSWGAPDFRPRLDGDEAA